MLQQGFPLVFRLRNFNRAKIQPTSGDKKNPFKRRRRRQNPTWASGQPSASPEYTSNSAPCGSGSHSWCTAGAGCWMWGYVGIPRPG